MLMAQTDRKASLVAVKTMEKQYLNNIKMGTGCFCDRSWARQKLLPMIKLAPILANQSNGTNHTRMSSILLDSHDSISVRIHRVLRELSRSLFPSRIRHAGP